MTTIEEDAPPRRVGILLMIGIFFLPFIFAWFTLRKGYTLLARAVSFGWMVLLILILALTPAPPASDGRTAEIQTAATVPTKTPEQIKTEAEAAETKEFGRHPERALDLVSSNATKEGFDTVLVLSGTITNRANFAIKDPRIVCDLTGPSGTKVGTVRQTLYETVPASGSKHFKELNMGFMGSSQVAQFSCSIIAAVGV